jgi:lysozyme
VSIFNSAQEESVMSPKKDKEEKEKGKNRKKKIVPAAPEIVFDQPDPARVLGLSTSHWTGVVDWQVAKANGIQFAIMKARHGLKSVAYFKENYRGAKDAGILVGAYLWLQHATLSSPGTQARAYAKFLLDYPVDLPPFVDYEWSKEGKRYNPIIDDLWGCVVPFSEAYGKQPGIYTAPGYWNERGSTNALWASFPLWLAQYRQGLADPLNPWIGYDFLQWTEIGEGIQYGVPVTGERSCELNYWRGTREELLTFCGLPPEE